jgi:hypothetical protein
MNYSYDHRKTATSPKAILELLIKSVLADRDTAVKHLLSAFIETLVDDYETDEVVGIEDVEKALNFVKDKREVERIMMDIYANTYVKLFRPSDRADALESWEIPDAFYQDDIPMEAIEAVARAMAIQDAKDANAMRREMLRRQR